MSKKLNGTDDMINKVMKRKQQIERKGKKLPPEQRDTPIPYARVHETPKNNPRKERKTSKALRHKVMRGDYE